MVSRIASHPGEAFAGALTQASASSLVTRLAPACSQKPPNWSSSRPSRASLKPRERRTARYSASAARSGRPLMPRLPAREPRAHPARTQPTGRWLPGKLGAWRDLPAPLLVILGAPARLSAGKRVGKHRAGRVGRRAPGDPHDPPAPLRVIESGEGAAAGKFLGGGPVSAAVDSDRGRALKASEGGSLTGVRRSPSLHAVRVVLHGPLTRPEPAHPRHAFRAA